MKSALHERLARIAWDLTVIGHQVAATDRWIDRLVYDLYGLADVMKRIIEEGTAR